MQKKVEKQHKKIDGLFEKLDKKDKFRAEKDKLIGFCKKMCRVQTNAETTQY